jgi:uncharacterized protein (UPF0548 family)
MKIFISRQEKRFDTHLKELIGEGVILYDKSSLHEKTSTIELGIFRLNDVDITALFTYNIFPPSIMTFQTQWQLENRTIQVNDNIVQQVFIPPLGKLSCKIIFGVRINRIIDEPNRKGFSYETLKGHVEKGESTFTIEKNGDHLIFKIQTFSVPANSIVRTFGSWLAIPYQTYCTKRALQNVKRQIEG